MLSTDMDCIGWPLEALELALVGLLEEELARFAFWDAWWPCDLLDSCDLWCDLLLLPFFEWPERTLHRLLLECFFTEEGALDKELEVSVLEGELEDAVVEGELVSVEEGELEDAVVEGELDLVLVLVGLDELASVSVADGLLLELEGLEDSVEAEPDEPESEPEEPTCAARGKLESSPKERLTGPIPEELGAADELGADELLAAAAAGAELESEPDAELGEAEELEEAAELVGAEELALALDACLLLCFDTCLAGRLLSCFASLLWWCFFDEELPVAAELPEAELGFEEPLCVDELFPVELPEPEAAAWSALVAEAIALLSDLLALGFRLPNWPCLNMEASCALALLCSSSGSGTFTLAFGAIVGWLEPLLLACLSLDLLAAPPPFLWPPIRKGLSRPKVSPFLVPCSDSEPLCCAWALPSTANGFLFAP